MSSAIEWVRNPDCIHTRPNRRQLIRAVVPPHCRELAIKAKSLVAFGFIDTVSPPFGILAAFNQIQGPKEAVPMPASDHNNITPQQEGGYIIRSREALESLRKTGDITPNENWFQQ